MEECIIRLDESASLNRASSVNEAYSVKKGCLKTKLEQAQKPNKAALFDMDAPTKVANSQDEVVRENK